MPGTPVSMKPFGMADFSTGARGIRDVDHVQHAHALARVVRDQQDVAAEVHVLVLEVRQRAARPTGTGSSGFVTS